MKPIIRTRVPREAYDAIHALNISRLKEIARSPLHYQYRLAHPKNTPTLKLGNAAHRAVLEPERFADYAVWRRRAANGNMAPRNGQYWEAFLLEADGRETITEDEELEALEVQAAVRSNAIAMKYLAAGEPEVTMCWLLADRVCKGRVDWLTSLSGRSHLVGLKTARECREYPFAKQAANLGYHLQWAYYFDAHVHITGEEPRVIEIVVETGDGPHDVVVYEIPNEVIVQGRYEYQELLKRLEECERTDRWPGTAETELSLTFPDWAFNQELADSSSLEFGSWS